MSFLFAHFLVSHSIWIGSMPKIPHASYTCLRSSPMLAPASSSAMVSQGFPSLEFNTCFLYLGIRADCYCFQISQNFLQLLFYEILIIGKEL